MFFAVIEMVFALIGAVGGVAAMVAYIREKTLLAKYENDITWNDALTVAEGVLQQIEKSKWKPD
ncbi:MAG: hypothetical protein ACHQ50_09175, partial [Fimbriimonadales bacterium]